MDLNLIAKKLNSYITFSLRAGKELYKLTQIYTQTLFRSESIQEYAGGEEYPLVVFNTVTPIEPHLPIELELASIFADHNYRCIIILDRGRFPFYDKVHYAGNDDLKWWDIQSGANKVLIWIRLKQWLYANKHRRIEVLYTDDILDNSPEIPHSSELDSHVRASLIRYFQDENPEIYPQFNRAKSVLENNARASYQCGIYVVKQIKPEIFFTSHGIYTTWGPAFDAVNQSGITSFVYANHVYQPGNISLSDGPFQRLTVDGKWQAYLRDEIYTDEIVNKSVAILSSRTNRRGVDLKLYDFNDDGVQELIDISNGFKRTFGLFPNVIWDGNIPERDTIFNGLIEWIRFTIDSVKGTDNLLIIRFHPSEFRVITDAIPLETHIRREFPNIDCIGNVILLSSNNPINSYALINDVIDVGITYDGNLSFEIPYLNKPVIAAGEGRFSHENWCYLASDKSMYLSWIINPTCVIEDFEKSSAEKKAKMLKFYYWFNYVNRFSLQSLQTDKYPPQFLEPTEYLVTKSSNVGSNDIYEYIMDWKFIR